MVKASRCIGMRLICGHSFWNNLKLCRVSIIGNNWKATFGVLGASGCAHGYKAARGVPFYCFMSDSSFVVKLALIKIKPAKSHYTLKGGSSVLILLVCATWGHSY